MPAILPFLMSANDAGVISLIIFLTSAVILTIPVFANRGKSQLMWLGVVSVVLLIEAALLITWVALISNGTLDPSIS